MPHLMVVRRCRMERSVCTIAAAKQSRPIIGDTLYRSGNENIIACTAIRNNTKSTYSMVAMTLPKPSVLAMKHGIKATFFQMAEKDAARYDWEKRVYLAIRDYQPPVPYSIAIQNIRAEIRSVFPNITKEGEQRLLKERAKNLKLPGGVRPASKRVKRAKKKL